MLDARRLFLASVALADRCEPRLALADSSVELGVDCALARRGVDALDDNRRLVAARARAREPGREERRTEEHGGYGEESEPEPVSLQPCFHPGPPSRFTHCVMPE